MEQVVVFGGNRASTDYGREDVEVLTATKSLNAADTGKIFYLNAATEFTTTLPAIADAEAGWNCMFIVAAAPAAADYVITELAASDTNKVIVNGINELEVDTGDDGPYSAGCTTVSFVDGVAVAGDWIKVRCDGTNYFVTGQTKADGGVAAA